MGRRIIEAVYFFFSSSNSSSILTSFYGFISLSHCMTQRIELHNKGIKSIRKTIESIGEGEKKKRIILDKNKFNVVFAEHLKDVKVGKIAFEKKIVAFCV